MQTNKLDFPELRELKQILERRLETLRHQAAEVEKQLISVTTTLGLLQQGQFETRDLFTVVPSDLQGLTQLQAIVKIAKANNNRITMKTAKDLLIRSGLTKTAKNANNIIFNVITRSEMFKRVAPGEYELLKEKGNNSSTETKVVSPYEPGTRPQ